MNILRDSILFSNIEAKIDYKSFASEFNYTLNHSNIQILNYKDVQFNAENSVELILRHKKNVNKFNEEVYKVSLYPIEYKDFLPTC